MTTETGLSNWQIANVEFDSARPLIVITGLTTGDSWLAANDDGSLTLEGGPPDIRSQWILYLADYEKNGLVSIRRRTPEGSSLRLWLEANTATGTAKTSNSAAPGAGGLWRIQKVAP